jgi:hypothetical protein
MRITIPPDLPSDPREAYRRGWRDRTRKAAKAGGSSTTEAKQIAARANGAKGGRPRKPPSNAPLPARADKAHTP